MNSFPSRWVQHILFFVPYAFTALTCVTLWAAVGLQDDDDSTPTLRVAAWFNSTALALYVLGWLGPHYLKLGCGFFNCAVVGYMVLLQGDWRPATLLLAVYIVPAMVFVLQAIWVPSVNEIVPRIYIGNRGAARSSTILQQCQITHILELTGSSSLRRQQRETTVIASPNGKDNGKTITKIIKKQVYVNDFWACHNSLAKVLDECMTFMHTATTTCTNAAVLVHCSAGQSRSAAFLINYLMAKQQTQQQHSWKDVYRWLRSKRPVVDIHSDHLQHFRALEEASQSKLI